jgi:hypothetical protein
MSVNDRVTAALLQNERPETSAQPNGEKPATKLTESKGSKGSDVLAETATVTTGASRPAQSLQGHFLKDFGSALLAAKLRSHGRKCFYQMLKREYEHWDDFVVFYHSYNSSALLFEVNSAIARAIYDLPLEFAPLPRLLKKPFEANPTIDVLSHNFYHMDHKDSNSSFRGVAISVSNSLFGDSTPAPPMECFEHGYTSTTHYQFAPHDALRDLLRTCGLVDDQLEKIANDLRAIACEFGISEELHSPAVPATPQGHMLQIFLHKDSVNHLAYLSDKQGVPKKMEQSMKSILRPLKSAVYGHSRLLAHPAVFIDPGQVKMYYYSSSCDFMGDGPRSRSVFLEKLNLALTPIIGDAEGLRRAYLGVEGRDACEPS